MRHIVLMIAAAIVLSGCDEPSDAQRKNLRDVLPDGCEVRELGHYGGIKNLIVVVCDGRSTSTTIWQQTSVQGKITTTRDFTSMYIGEKL